MVQRDSFTSKFGIIAAAAGSAIGLGNIWRFPYEVGANGGGAFLIVYLIFILTIGIPVMLSEFVIGRSTQSNPYGAFKKLAPGKPWSLIGIAGVFAAFMILAFYSAVGGWTLEYLSKSVFNEFAGQSREELDFMFKHFRAESFMTLFWQVIFMILTFLIVISGIEKGIEKYAKILMPVLLLLLVIIAIRSVTLPETTDGKPVEGLLFLFKPDFSKLNASVIFAALGQAFFSLSIGMGALITYGSYINKNDNLGNSAVIVSLSDTFIAILAGVAIFPAVFTFGINPQAGTGLVFQVLPNIFQQIPGGYFISILFFILLTVAALTSSISLLEVVVTTFVEEFRISRKKACTIAALLITVLGAFCSLAWNTFDWLAITTTDSLTGEPVTTNFFGILEIIALKFILPLGGLFIVIYLGWFYGRERAIRELSNEGTLKITYFRIYLFLVKYVAPFAILLVFLNGVGVI